MSSPALKSKEIHTTSDPKALMSHICVTLYASAVDEWISLPRNKCMHGISEKGYAVSAILKSGAETFLETYHPSLRA